MRLLNVLRMVIGNIVHVIAGGAFMALNVGYHNTYLAWGVLLGGCTIAVLIQPNPMDAGGPGGAASPGKSPDPEGGQ